LLFLNAYRVKAQTELPKSEPDSFVVLHHTSVINITANSNDVTYPIFVCLPGSYDYSNKTYPVIYMLDAYSSFGIMTQMQHLLAFDKELPEAIIVGISSKGGSKDFIYNRARDYTPTFIPQDSLPSSVRLMTPASGGASKFLQFIKDQLIPAIETKYRTDRNDKTLVGHSYGGLFCFYTLFSDPMLFNRYVILSPALLWDNDFVLREENDFSKLHKSLNVRIYTAVGSLEPDYILTEWQKLISAILSRNYSGLSLKDEILPNETHYTMIPFMSTHGLKYVFGNK
jgi:hypothetical protein